MYYHWSAFMPKSTKKAMFILCFSSGQPSTYSEYFSLNRTTAALLLLKPVSRDLYTKFIIIIKVSKSTFKLKSR